jgi:hypothetical protein
MSSYRVKPLEKLEYKGLIKDCFFIIWFIEMVKPKKILRLRNDAGGIVAMPSDSIGNKCFN